MSMIKRFFAVAAATVLFSVPAFAVPLSGEINIGGTVIFKDSADQVVSGSNLSTAVKATFPNTDTEVKSASTTYDYLGAIGGTAVYNDFTFVPVNADTPFVVWEVNNGSNWWKFTLESMAGGYANIFGTDYIVLSGNGFVETNLAGIDPTTNGHWTFSSQGGTSTFSFSSTTVSEPQVLAIMGLGLLAMGAAARRKKAA